MIEENVQSAMTYVNEMLGFDAWSRELHDDQQIYGFLLPPEVFNNERLTKNLLKFITNVFYAHFLRVEESYVMPDSSIVSIREIMGTEYCDSYEVDWCGSRSRQVDLGPHFYFRLVFTGWLGRLRVDPQPPSLEVHGEELKWEIINEYPDSYTHIQRARLVAHGV